MKLHLPLLIIGSALLAGAILLITASRAEQGVSLSDQQEKKDYGIGPVKDVKLGPIDPKMAQKGRDLFNNKCLLCHDLDQKKIGPPLRNISKTRTPEFIMNLLLNTVQMQKENPTVRDLLSVYKVPMTPPELTTDQVRSVLEYLRSVAK